jgi:hypothetical protein
MRGVIGAGENPSAEAKAELEACPSMEGLDLASKVTTRDRYTWGDPTAKRHIIAYDFGIKRNLVLAHHRGNAYVVGARAFTFLCDPDDFHLRPGYSSSSETPMSFMAPFQVSLFSKPSRLPPP